MTPAPLAISCGEPAGIGPEVSAAAWRALRGDIPMLWFGDPRHLPPGTPFEHVSQIRDAARICRDALPVRMVPFASDVTPGHADLRNASGVIAAIRAAVAEVQADRCSAVVTAPIHKKALQDGAGFAYPGHTEFLQALGGADGRAVMMLSSPALRVVPATIHIPLSEVPHRLTPDLLRDTIRITAQDLTHRFGLTRPRIAVAGLNPHAGEAGAMGGEELDWIAPLIDDLRGQGFCITGPHSADTLFHAAARARYDVAVAMYHDQALIPIKTLDFDRGVNVTLGLPFVRCSPDHGTAFDIAGTGQANPQSMIEACKLAWSMAQTSAPGTA